MESRKIYYLRIFASVLFAAVILAAFAFVCIKGDLENNILSFGCICATALLSLLFVQWTPKKILLTISLAISVLADIFLVLLPSQNNYFVGIWLLAAVQVAYLVFTLFLIKGNGLRAISLAIRAGICMLVYFLLPQYLVLTTIQMLFAMIVINAFVTLMIFLIFFKTQWLTFLGFLLLFAFLFFSALDAGWGSLFKFSEKFLTFITSPYKQLPSLAFLCYVPANLLLALSSVWEKTKRGNFVRQKKASAVKVEKTTANPSKSQGISRPTQSEGVTTISLDDLN